MMDVVERLTRDFNDPDYRHVYDEGFLNSSIATQIKVLREERGWTQAHLAGKAKMNQSRVSELEDVNFNSWTMRTLRKLARALDLRLKISFEEFGTLLRDFRDLNRESLSRRSFGSDPAFQSAHAEAKPMASARALRIAPMPPEPELTASGVSSQEACEPRHEVPAKASKADVIKMPPMIGHHPSQYNGGNTQIPVEGRL
jgi:transcriptional regulator with XRE-family HTH domain